jgi:ABC-type lipoprotein release transport system permease subunit
MGQHGNKLNTVVEKLEVVESTMLFEVKVMVFLMIFPNIYQSLVMSLESY